MSGGPRPMERSRRLQLAYEIADEIQRHYNDELLALGVYGSVARGTQGPYSDIEMHCVLRGKDFVTAHEWSTGPWKAEVDVYTEDVILRWASEVDGDWPLTHGAFVDVLSIFDPADFFDRLRVTTLSQPDRVFVSAIRDVIVGHLYELIGKIRNARASADVSTIPYLATQLAKHGACLIGLAHRHVYTSPVRMFEESKALPGRPAGYDALCGMVQAGDLRDRIRVANVADAFWSGVEAWAQERGIRIAEDLGALLSRAPSRVSTPSARQKAVEYVRERGNQLDQLRLKRALGEPFELAEAEAVLAPYQFPDGSFDYRSPDEVSSRVGSLGGTLHVLRWLREFGLGSRSQMMRTLDFLTHVQDTDASFYETSEKLSHSAQEWLKRETLLDRFFFTAAVPMRLFSLGYSEHPLIEPAMKWLRGYWSDWPIVTATPYNLCALLCLSRAPVGMSGSLYQRCYAKALGWLDELNAQALTWILDALQGARFSVEEPLVKQGLKQLANLQTENGAWPDPRVPVETTVTALRLLRDFGMA